VLVVRERLMEHLGSHGLILAWTCLCDIFVSQIWRMIRMNRIDEPGRSSFTIRSGEGKYPVDQIGLAEVMLP
jgi:hypothetical protein